MAASPRVALKQRNSITEECSPNKVSALNILLNGFPILFSQVMKKALFEEKENQDQEA